MFGDVWVELGVFLSFIRVIDGVLKPLGDAAPVLCRVAAHFHLSHARVMQCGVSMVGRGVHETLREESEVYSH